jgi:hypothetical protein
MLRTIQNVIDMTADVYKIPYLKIDLVCEESGIEAVPKVPDIIAIYHKIIDDVSINVQLNVPRYIGWKKLVINKNCAVYTGSF